MRWKRYGASLVLLAVSVLTAQTAPAHPHVWVDVVAGMEFDGEKLRGVRMDWAFDEMFGSMILEDYDRDGDRVLSDAEIAAVKSGAFDNLAEFGWFTWIDLDGEEIAVEDVREFRAWIDGGVLHYSFLIPCSIPVEGKRNLLISVFDSEYYVDFWFNDTQPVTFSGAESVRTEWEVSESETRTFYMGMVRPMELTLTLTPK